MISFIKCSFLSSTWHTPMNGLLEHCQQILKDALYDHTRPFTCHYGAIVAITGFGSKV